ncbi:hypothetical protein [Micromonospora avicenniae]|uniref:Uncharacterized protein n=1 Tax=Micromonospora avicenniae TaxID=1198245 RepID=A0A1N7FK63_9ACTN|nr:hypothetical protein [Micromonospora avicenniae]SIS00808.1 hypothetical protein SAMN05444858_13914 [Micromonospora avicenniae]
MFDTTVVGQTGQGEWNQGEDEMGRRRWHRRRRWAPDDEFAQGGAEFEDEDEDAGEEQFLPIVAAGLKLLPAILGSLGGGKEAEYEEGEEGEDEERFIGNLLTRFLGESEYEEEVPLSPAQEAELAGRLLEVSDEDELKRVLGKIVNVVGSALQGVGNAASSPQGRALVEAMTPVARTVVPGTGLSPGEVFETEVSGLSQEQEVFEAARQAVRLTAAAAQNVASAPPGAPPEVVGELGIIRAASRLARPLFGRALRAVSPLVRRALGVRRYGVARGGFRYGRPYRRSYGGYRSPRHWGGYRGPRYGGYRYPYGYPPPSGYVEGPLEPMGPPPAAFPGPSPEPPGPPQPGYRWVAVPIGAPAPPVVPSEPPPGPAAPPDGPPPGQPGQGEWGQGEWGPGEWAQGEWGHGEWGQGEWNQGEYLPGVYAQEAEDAPGMNGSDGDRQTGRWVRRRGKIVVLGA